MIPLNRQNIGYEDFWDIVGKSYHEALRDNDVKDFYLGKNLYYYPEKDNYDLHNEQTTFYALLSYAKDNGNKKMLQHFRTDVKGLLKGSLDLDEFRLILGYILQYILEYYDFKKLDLEWRVDLDIRELLYKHYTEFISLHGDSENEHIARINSIIEIVRNLSGINMLDYRGLSDIDATTLKHTRLKEEIAESRYEEARNKGEVDKFLLGEESYLILTPGTIRHNKARTMKHLKCYGEIFGHELLSKDMEYDLTSIFKKEYSYRAFLNLLIYVQFLLNYRKEYNLEVALNDDLTGEIKKSYGNLKAAPAVHDKESEDLLASIDILLKNIDDKYHVGLSVSS